MKKPVPLLSALQNLRHKAEDVSAGFPALMAAAEKAVTTLHAGDHAHHKAGSGEKFWQFREYDSADRPQDIDWRQSAKGDHVYIRQKEQQSAQDVLFWLQNDQGMRLHHSKAKNSKYDAGMIISLALSLLLTRAGEHVGSLTQPGRTGRSEKTIETLGYSLLKSADPLPEGPSLPEAVVVPKRTSLILCGDFMTLPESTDRALGNLATRESQGLIIQILDPAETDLPYQGRVIFRPMDDTREILVSNVPSIRKTYADRLEAHIQTVRTIARRHRFDHMLYVTRDDPRVAISSAWNLLTPQLRLQAGG
jgi:uncharacterized protein (DUF58 family)